MRLRTLAELLAVNTVIRHQEEQLRQQAEQTALLRDAIQMQEAAFAVDHPDLYQEAQRQRLEEERQQCKARHQLVRERQTTALVLTILACVVVLPLIVFLAIR